jgi:hypothetical protein
MPSAAARDDDDREPRWATLRQASTYSGVPVRRLRDWISAGKLPASRMGPKIITVDLDDVDRLRQPIPTAGHFADDAELDEAAHG